MLKRISDLAGLGRLWQWDARNARFPLPLREAGTITRRMWYGGKVYDQGDTPQCVGYAGYGWLRGGPIVNYPKFTPSQLYLWAQDEDDRPGNNYDGTTTIGLMRALKARGYISEYRWAFDTDTIMAWVLTTGPVIVGSNWYMDMFTPRMPGDFLEPTGELVGGHEWRIVGADMRMKCPDGSIGAFRMVNSYGYNWGSNGRAWVSRATMQRLLDEQGEAVTPTELKVTAINA